MHLAAHSLLEIRPMIAFSKGSGLCPGSGTGSPDRIAGPDRRIGSPDIFRHPARPGPGEAALPSAAEHAPTPTHSRIRTHVDTIDFNTPRLSSFGKKKTMVFNLRMRRNQMYAPSLAGGYIR